MSIKGTVTAVSRDSWGDDLAPSDRIVVQPDGGGKPIVIQVGRIELGARIEVPVLTTDGHAELRGGVKVKMLGSARGFDAPLP